MKMKLTILAVVACLGCSTALAASHQTASAAQKNAAATMGSKGTAKSVSTITTAPATYQKPAPSSTMNAKSAQTHPAVIAAKKPLSYKPSAQRLVRLHMTTGSLKTNIERVARQNGWPRVVWEPDHDFRWTGNVAISASSLQAALTRVLQHYPVQAVFYQGNHVLVIMPRTLQ